MKDFRYVSRMIDEKVLSVIAATRSQLRAGALLAVR